MSAIAEEGVDGPNEIVKVLFALYEGLDALDFTGPLEVLSTARHNIKDPNSEAFDCTFAGPSEHVMTRQGLTVTANISYKEAHANIKDYDILIVPGGTTAKVLEADAEPIPLVRAFAEAQKADSARERTLMSVCTGALLLAQAGVLQGFAATTHPDAYIQLEKLCQRASAMVSSERTDVMEERYVVNNARFDLGDDLDENPFVTTKEDHILSHKERRRSSVARKGSNAWRESNKRRESTARRAMLRLGGMRVITSGAVASGIDAALYLVCAMVSDESAQEVARVLQFNWTKGVVVNAIDV